VYRRLAWLPLAAALLLTAGGGAAQALRPVPPLTGQVVDTTGTLTDGGRADLEARLAALETRKGSQVAVLLVATTAPEAIEAYAIRVVDAWQLGRGDVDDGVLLLVAIDDRAVRLEVGYGLEGTIPDATANRVIDEYILPRFRAGDYAGGIDAGVDRVIALIDGEPLPPPAAAASDPLAELFPMVFILALVLGSLLRRLLGALPGALATGGIAALVTWFLAGVVGLALFMGVVGFFVGLAGGGGGGRWASHPRGRHGGGFGGGFGGGGGGGFRGGGGGFGGGGASGRW